MLVHAQCRKFLGRNAYGALDRVRRKRGLLKPHGQLISFVARALDVTLIAVAGVLAYGARFGFEAIGSMRSDYVSCLLAGVLLAGIVLPACRVYRSWRGVSVATTIARAVLAWSAAFVALLLLLFAGHWTEDYSRLWLGYWAVLSAVAVGLVRLGVYGTLSWARRRGFNVRRVVLFGAGELGRNVLDAVSEGDWTGFRVVAVLDDDADKQGVSCASLTVRTDTDSLAEVVRETSADEVWFTLPLRAEERMHELLHQLRHSVVNIRLMPDVFGLRLLNHSITDLAGIPAINLTETPLTGVNQLLKVIEDRVLASIILFLISPLMLVIALGVKISSPGPVLFRQERVGWNGKVFQMLKFRSMPVGAESDSGARWASADDRRATRLGAFLRRTRLDELPQFLNVLLGDMSIVGPRPERPVFVERFKDDIPDYMQKHLVKAGITGWAQVNGWRGNTDLTKRIEYDLYYIENWSIGFDFVIMLRTIFSGFVHPNAY